MSPMNNIFAGLKLYGKKPRQAPIRAASTRGMSKSSPTTFMATTSIVADAIVDTPQASSVKSVYKIYSVCYSNYIQMIVIGMDRAPKNTKPGVPETQ